MFTVGGSDSRMHNNYSASELYIGGKLDAIGGVPAKDDESVFDINEHLRALELEYPINSSIAWCYNAICESVVSTGISG